MDEVTIWGRSDDLIELEGSIDEELYAYDRGRTLVFSDGTALHVQYDLPDYSGMWKIERIREGTAEYTHKPAADPDDDYTDRVTLRGEDLKLVSAWRGVEPTREELLFAVEDLVWRDLTDDQLKRVVEVVK